MSDEFARRLQLAKTHRRNSLDGEGRECYKFCFNGRESEWDGRSSASNEDADEIFTDFPSTVAEDFAGELFTTMTPENTPWVEYEAADEVEESDAAQVEGQVTQYENLIAKAIRKSNYYDEGLTAFYDAVVGNVAMWVDRPTLNSPVVCEAIPIAETYLRLGPFGLDDRFRVRKYATQDLKALFPDATWTTKQKKKMDGKTGTSKVEWGFWRTYADPENPIWRQEIRVDGEPCGLDKDLEGEGSVPMICGRFGAVANSAWGRGPARRMLPTIRSLDALVSMNLEGMDRTLDPAYIYPHDGMLDLSEGIEPGVGYPSMPGSGDSITPLGLSGSLDYGFFSEEKMEDRIRDGFYRENSQRGKTPPSASQYVGDKQKQLARIARPGAKTWREFGVGLLKRFEYIESQVGGSLEGANPLEDGDIVARPISPLERAQAGEDVMVTQSMLAMARETLGEQMAGLMIDGPTTFTNVKRMMKEKNIALRTQDEIMDLLAQQQPQQQEQPNAEAPTA